MRWFALLFIILIVSCNNKPGHKPAGGPCSYISQPFQFTILAVERDSSFSIIQGLDTTNPAIGYPPDSLFTVRVKLCCDVRRKDSFYLTDIIDKRFTLAEATANGIKQGSIIDGQVDLIVTGTCTPETYRFNNPLLQ